MQKYRSETEKSRDDVEGKEKVPKFRSPTSQSQAKDFATRLMLHYRLYDYMYANTYIVVTRYQALQYSLIA